MEHPAPENSRPPHATWRVLFLDTSNAIELLKGACKAVGYVVIGSTTIDEAMSFLVGKDHVDVIVCAAHLQEESMFELLKTVRASDQHKSSMFLILSLEPSEAGSRLDRSVARAGIALGADAYLIMPVFDPHDLVAQIRKLQPSVPRLQQSDAPPDDEHD